MAYHQTGKPCWSFILGICFLTGRKTYSCAVGGRFLVDLVLWRKSVYLIGKKYGSASMESISPRHPTERVPILQMREQIIQIIQVSLNERHNFFLRECDIQ